MTKTEIISQCFGLIGVLSFVLSFQIKSNKKLYLVQMFSNSMFVIQFILLGAYSGCINLVICILRNLIFINRKKWTFVEKPLMLALLIGLFILNTIINWHAWYDIFSLIAVMAATVAFWTGNPRDIRTHNLFVASPCWIVYDIAVGAWAGVANEVIGMTSIIISIIRFGWKSLGASGKEYE